MPIRYASYPTAPVFVEKRGTQQVKQLLWGDWVNVTGDEDEGRIPVRVRGHDGWMRPADLEEERLLEVVFVDIGQGDGCLLVTPDDRHVVIDAGERSNMHRFLAWRYNGFRDGWEFDAFVISHPDQDHYKGFQSLFANERVTVKRVLHNGIIEDTSKAGFDATTDADGRRWVAELMETQDDLNRFLENEARWKGKVYPAMLERALRSGRVEEVRMLSTHHSDDGFVPGYGPTSAVQLEVLGPVPEASPDGKQRLRWFRKEPFGGSYDKGKTKNGHSVILRLQYGEVSLLLGGDLNSASETYLLEHYSGIRQPPRTADERERTIRSVAERFGVDVAKSCHHGSADFTDEFLAAVRPAATIISSGDENSHAHPRSDTLGAIGLHGRGWRPLIFSTELSRSTRELEAPDALRKIGRLDARIDKADGAERAALVKERLELLEDLARRNVTVYGAINLRTDGRKAVLAYKLEQKGTTPGGGVREWDVYRLERQDSGMLAYVRPDGPIAPAPRDDDPDENDR